MLAEKYASEIENILSKYPLEQKRSAVMPLLFLAQAETGHITSQAVEEIAGMLDMSTTEVGSLLGFYTLYHDEPGGKYRVQICTDLPCALRGAEQFAEQLCENLGLRRLGGTTEDGLITVEEVMCLAGCDKAPLFQVQGPDGIQYQEEQTVESAAEVIEALRRRDADA